jgi:ribosomal protein S18 acetylase RimI-like enzyme
MAVALWKASDGIGLSSADSRDAISKYLARNPAMSFAAYDGAGLAGTVLCGHDGRRGYVHHLAVAAPYRRKGIGLRLVKASLAALRAEGIEKCHLFVFRENAAAQAFWTKVKWTERTDLVIFSAATGAERVL